jgi:hypothetical protein
MPGRGKQRPGAADYLGGWPCGLACPLDGAGAAHAIDRRGGSTMQDDIEHERHKKRERNADQDALPPRNQHVPWHGSGLSAF